MEQLKNILETASVRRLRGILRSRYGTGLQVEFMTDLTSAEMTSQSPSLHEGVLRIPIFSGNRFLAKALLPSLHKISLEETETISDLVKLVLEPLISRWLESQNSDQNSTGSGSLFQISTTSENVIPLFRNNVDAEMGKVVRSLLTAVIYLETSNPHRLPRVISEIHEISRRWARVDFEQIENNVKGVSDIQSLGALTLVVNDLVNLRPEKLNFLVEYIKSRPTEEMPLILISSSSPVKDLIENQTLTPESALIIRQCVLEVDRLPHKNDQLRKTLELFLEPGAIL